MESATDALDFDLYVDEKKREAVSLHFRLVVLTDKTALGIVKQMENQDGFEAYRRLAIRYAPRTLGRNLTRLTSIIDHDFGSDESQMLDKIASWERQIEEHERRAHLSSAEDALARQLTKRLGLDSDEKKHPIVLVGHSVCTETRADGLGIYIPWSNKGKGKDGKNNKGHKGDKGKGGNDGWWNKGGKGKSKNKREKGQGKSGGNAGGGKGDTYSAGYCGECGLWGHKQKNCRRQVNVVEEGQQQQQQQQPPPPTDVSHLSATDTSWIYTAVVDDRNVVDVSPVKVDEGPDDGLYEIEVDESPKATEMEVNPIIVDDRKIVDTPIAEITTDGHYGVEAMLDSGAGASVYGYKWVKAFVGKTQQILQVRFTVLDVLRPITALSCLVQGGCDLSFGGSPVEATATHRGTQRKLGLIQRTGLYFIPLLIAVQQVQHVRGHVIFSFEEEVVEDAARQEHAFHEGEEQGQQEAGEMKVPVAP
eukprot:6490331-Amphidinium_carterae.1